MDPKKRCVRERCLKSSWITQYATCFNGYVRHRRASHTHDVAFSLARIPRSKAKFQVLVHIKKASVVLDNPLFIATSKLAFSSSLSSCLNKTWSDVWHLC